MRRFRFNLEALLKLRRFEEEAAQRALAEALRAVEAQKDRIAVLIREREELLVEAAAQTETIPVERQRLLGYLEDLERRLREARQALDSLEATAHLRRAALHAAAKALKALEQLRERRREAFHAEALRREYAEVDEAVLQRLDKGDPHSDA